MNANLRNFALWVIIVLLLLALFTLFQNPGQRTATQDIPFSQLLTEVDQNHVRDVVIQGSEIRGTFTNGSTFQTYAPNDPTLVKRLYDGKVAIMSFDHWLIREFAEQAPGIPAGLTAWGDKDHEIEAHFSMLAHDISFVSYNVAQLDNRFIRFVREKLGMPVITWTVRDEEAVKETFARADQMTFEGFEPDAIA